MRKVKWGVLGTADIARGQTIPGMQLAEHCELYAIAGRKPEKAQSYKEQFGFRKAYGSYDELLADPEVEAVYIPLPNDLHCEWSIRALKAKKHVLCEKPLAVSETQVQEMFRAAEENGVMLMEAFAYLHSPFVKAVKAELDAGTIGEIRYLESAFITGRRPDTDIRLRKVFTSALLLYDNGAVANLDCGMLLPEGRLDRFRIHGTLGTIVSPVEFNQAGEIPYTVIRNGVKETKTVNAPNNYSLESEQLSRCILTGEKPHVTKEFSLLVARVTDRILKEIGY